MIYLTRAIPADTNVKCKLPVFLLAIFSTYLSSLLGTRPESKDYYLGRESNSSSTPTILRLNDHNNLFNRTETMPHILIGSLLPKYSTLSISAPNLLFKLKPMTSSIPNFHPDFQLLYSDGHLARPTVKLWPIWPWDHAWKPLIEASKIPSADERYYMIPVSSGSIHRPEPADHGL